MSPDDVVLPEDILEMSDEQLVLFLARAGITPADVERSFQKALSTLHQPKERNDGDDEDEHG